MWRRRAHRRATRGSARREAAGEARAVAWKQRAGGQMTVLPPYADKRSGGGSISPRGSSVILSVKADEVSF